MSTTAVNLGDLGNVHVNSILTTKRTDDFVILDKEGAGRSSILLVEGMAGFADVMNHIGGHEVDTIQLDDF